MNVDRPGPVLCFGETLLRLSSAAGVRLASASTLDICIGGAEANVAAMLAQLGHQVEMVTVLPATTLGDLCEAEFRRVGVGIGRISRREGRLGLYFLGSALGAGGEVIYDRKHSAFTQHSDEFDWPMLAQTARWFHLTGINLALGDKPAQSALAAVQAMKAAGVPVSFDVNHRSSLWKDQAPENFGFVRQVADLADLLFASPRALALILNRDDLAGHRGAAEAAFGAFPGLQLIACTRRQFDEDRQLLSARMDDRDGGHETAPAPLRSVIDRIGSGDAFAGAVIDGVLGEMALDACAAHGLAAAVSKHCIAGDRWIGTRDELYAFDPFSAQDVQR
jgi:2-dehydro-3-deoxygluconokinase